MALGADEGRDEHRYASGSCKQALIRRFPEWGKPTTRNGVVSISEFIGYRRQTRGTETSKYPEEEKANAIP